MRLEKKVALVTGGATGDKEGEVMGFGGAACWLFAREGAKVVLTDINEELGNKTAAQIRESGGEATFVRHDVTSEKDWINAIQTTVSTYGKLNVLVNNAGKDTPYNVEGTSSEEWDAHMDLHAKAAFLGTKLAIPEMRKAGGGSIINVGSIYALVGAPASTTYSAAKAAVRMFTRSTAVQYGKENIRANCVHPGYMVTPMTIKSYHKPESRNRWLSLTPMNKLGTADDIAYAMLYLASDESAFVTGAELVIDGGMTAQ